MNPEIFKNKYQITTPEDDLISFMCVTIGEVFFFEGDYFMKTEGRYNSNNLYTNAVKLFSGGVHFFTDSDKIKVVKQFTYKKL